MMDSIENDFPEINEPKWYEQRELNWRLALKSGSWKSEYRRKDLEKIKKYFFTGQYDSSMPLASYCLDLIRMFPIQNEIGYQYYYTNTELSLEQLEKLTRTALMDLSHYGQDETAQLSYWDYHLGKTFQSKMIRITREGPIEIDLDPIQTAKSFISNLFRYMRTNSYSESPKWAVRLGYLFSLPPSVFEKIMDEDEEWMKDLLKNIIGRKFGQDHTKGNYRFTFAEDFERRMEETEGLPVRFLGLWKQLQKEAQS